jgi:hypothetical protein
MAEKKIQDRLFQLIREGLPPSVSLIDAVSDALHISTDSAYRRIRGETPLILEEVQALCRQFSLSLDPLLGTSSNAVVFQPVLVNNSGYTFDNYLSGLIQSLQYITSFKQKEIVYLSKDIPFFHYFNSKPLFAFRYFFWMKTILQHPDFVHQAFSMAHTDAAAEAKARELSRLYANIPSTEIWNSEGINSMLSQIDYYREAGYFASDAEITLLYEGLRQTLEHINQQAEWGCKFLPGENPELRPQNYNLYVNKVVIGDNTILVTLDGKKSVYINYDVLNYMTTGDAAFCNETSDKLHNLMRRATIISTVSEKQRSLFFNELLKKIPAAQPAY